ncbi:squalene/phytoene synthase family protein [Phenylobacterium sp.]|uniref:squalene/phytoene synthase family protein n=1 Tax=Phenylobacterium sp. TaxID=1871053 RepID=UPI002734EDD4|nr:squalene/phytoene synthase family protein [Phenylobacterium sp.]MDP3852224.1 squalene/phytoene synthase family protein [Phenylobacterium sp.]
MPDQDPSDLDALVQRMDPDRWLSSRLITDAAARADVVALYAYDYELARAPKVASNALMGEIRLTWWREVLDEVFERRPVRHHPAAQALAEAVRRHGLPRAPLEAMIDARYRELSPEPMNLADALEWAGDTGGAAAVLAARILDPAADPAKAASGGRAWSIGRLMGTAGMTGEGARGALDQALAGARGLSPAAFPAVAHATLARVRAKGERPSELAARGRLLWAVLTGRV